ncbi:MAG TPA: hypothetical protein VFB06_37665 [Streptosporangiaceae bacterium]|nr:hypothetical protein [Streptosporangiaceae bacterium]
MSALAEMLDHDFRSASLPAWLRCVDAQITLAGARARGDAAGADQAQHLLRIAAVELAGVVASWKHLGREELWHRGPDEGREFWDLCVQYGTAVRRLTLAEEELRLATEAVRQADAALGAG